MKRTLLLNSNFEVLNFINFKRAVKLIVAEKAESIAHWDEEITYSNGSITFPAILKLNYSPKFRFFKTNFDRKVLAKRDNNTCQYCLKYLSKSEITIDHIIPKCKGGKSSYHNCVVACKLCNCKKGDLLLEDSDLILQNKPVAPPFMINKQFVSRDQYVDLSENWHNDWNMFIR